MTEKAFDPLWTPLISHYDDAGIDAARTRRHIAAVAPYVRQYLVAGTTGDGWGMSDARLLQWLALVCDAATFTPTQKVLVGAFGKDAGEVIARARLIESFLAAYGAAAEFAGVTLCAPVKAEAPQAEIADHFREILAATRAPVAIYQLPQVTGCLIAPGTFATLAAESDRIVLFKDTSGADAVAEAGLGLGAAKLLRGAEGDYAGWLKPRGPYDGWLLSTANGFGAELRGIAETGDETLSGGLTALVEALFALAGGLGGNAFADANRAVDHLRAYGPAWPKAARPRRADGSALPAEFLKAAAAVMDAHGFAIGRGYLNA